MIQRSSVVIDKNKSKSFVSFMKTNAKNEDFWKEVGIIFDLKKNYY